MMRSVHKSNNNRILYIIILIILCLGHQHVHAQDYGFKSSVIAGFSAAQIRGDDIAGFNQVGLEGGIGVQYGIGYNTDLGLELLFSQRGSRQQLDFGSSDSDIQFRLNYLAIPLTFTIHDWVKENENSLYFKVNAHAGLAYSRLISAKVSGVLGSIGTDPLVDAFNENDISWMLGLGYQFSERMGFRFRYTRSVTKLFSQDDNPQVNYNDLLPFHLSLLLTIRI